MLPLTVLLLKSFKLYRNNFNLLAGYIAWLLLPYALQILLSLAKNNDLFELLSFLISLGNGILALWLSVFLLLVIYGLAKNEKRIALSRYQELAWHLLPSLLFVAILETAVILGGAVLLIVPAFIFMVWFGFSQSAVIFDKQRGLAALSFSREMVRGKFWPTAWRLLIGPLIIFLIMISLTGILILLTAGITGTSLSSLTGNLPPLWADVISIVIETFSLPLFLIFSTLLYQDLQKNKTISNDKKI